MKYTELMAKIDEKFKHRDMQITYLIKLSEIQNEAIEKIKVVLDNITENEDKSDNDECDKECTCNEELTNLRNMPEEVLKYFRKILTGRES